MHHLGSGTSDPELVANVPILLIFLVVPKLLVIYLNVPIFLMRRVVLDCVLY